MASATREMTVPSTAVWDLLSDGWSYAGWVVGTVRIRAVDPHWPAQGAKIEHSFGAWPLMIDDETEVLECEPGRRLVMQARGWPVGEATIELVLEPHGDTSTAVYMAETPTAGPGSWVNNPVFETVARHRIKEILDRVARLVEGQHALAVS